MPGKSTNDKVINLPNIIYRPCVLHVLVSPQKSLTKLGYDHSSTCYSRKASKKTWSDVFRDQRLTYAWPDTTYMEKTLFLGNLPYDWEVKDVTAWIRELARIG